MYPLKLTSPHQLARRNERLKLIAVVCAVLPGSLALLVTLLWMLQSQHVVAGWPFLPHSKVNGGIGLVAAAIALLLFVRGRPRMGMMLGIVPLAIGLATLWEHVSGYDLGIDQFVAPDLSGLGIPGRPAPNSATALSLLGAMYLALGLMRGGGRQDLVVKLLCFLTIAIAAEAVAGYVVGSSVAIGWGTTQKMSLGGAGCIIALAVGVLAHCMRAERSIFSQPSLWIPGLIAGGIGLLDLYSTRDFQLGVCYVALVAYGLWFPRRYFLAIFTALSICLVVFGYLAAPAGHILPSAALFNIVLAITAILLVAALVRQLLRSQDAVRHLDRHLGSIQQLSDTGSFELDLATMAFTTTHNFRRIHGFGENDAYDWTTFVNTVIPADEHAAVAAFMDAARHGASENDLDYTFLRADGETGEAVLRCLPTLDVRGIPVTIIGIVHDVTVQRREARQHEEIEATLRHAQKLESLGMLAGGIAHDLNNMLVPVTMLAPLLLETVEKPADQQSLEVIIGSARRAKELVREMLAFARKDPPGYEAVQLDQLIRDALTILRAGIPSDIALVEQLDPVPEICASKGQLYQVVLNLATNAAQAIGARSGTITIATANEWDAEAQAWGVRLSVSDDGEGMEQATLDRAFEPFFSTKEGQRGTGIGLSIAYGIVKSHGGTISAQSSRGAGARFDLVFPATQTGEPKCLAA